MQSDSSLGLIGVSYIVMKLSISSCDFWPFISVGVTSIQTLNNSHRHQCLRSADLNEASDYNHLFFGQFLFTGNNFVPKGTFGIFAATKVILLASWASNADNVYDTDMCSSDHYEQLSTSLLY